VENPWILPSGYVKIAIENGPVEIVDFPIKNGDFPVRYVKLPEGIVYKWWVNSRSMLLSSH
jgi:hypothetical protein